MGRRFCPACNRWFEPDSETRFLLIIEGVLAISPPPGTAPPKTWTWLWHHRRSTAACGQSCTLILTERYLDHQTFDRVGVHADAA